MQGRLRRTYGKRVRLNVSMATLRDKLLVPAGETTWGAVFIANGLQLILAVMLIVLGLNIVLHSVKSYSKSEKNSEKTAA